MASSGLMLRRRMKDVVSQGGNHIWIRATQTVVALLSISPVKALQKRNVATVTDVGSGVRIFDTLAPLNILCHGEWRRASE